MKTMIQKIQSDIKRIFEENEFDVKEFSFDINTDNKEVINGSLIVKFSSEQEIEELDEIEESLEEFDEDYQQERES